MKIGYVSPRYPPNVIGGGEKSLQLLVEHMRERDHEVEVLSFDEEPEDDYEFVTRHELDTNRADLQNIKARKKIKEFAKNKDVIHSYNMTFHPVVALLDDVKTVATLNSYHFFYPYSVPGNEKNPTSRVYRSIHDFVCRRLIRRMDCFIALSHTVKDQYSRILPGEKIEVVPNMYDPEFPEFRGIDTDPNELLYVGNMSKRKGVDDLVKQVPELPEEYHLTVVGDGPLKEELEKMISELGIEDRVNLEGYVEHDELPRFYERAGWFIHPGKWPEPFGRTILEAMQMETAVIATDRGGPRDILSEGQLADELNIKAVIQDLERNRVLESQSESLEKFHPEQVVSEFLDCYS